MIDKANSRLTNLIAMRADGEISKDEYQSMRSPIDAEIKELQKALDDTPTEKCSPRGLDLEGIRSTLNSLIDFILIHQYLEWVVWKLVNLGNGNIPNLA